MNENFDIALLNMSLCFNNKNKKDSTPLGLLYLATSLEKNGYKVKILDKMIKKSDKQKSLEKIVHKLKKYKIKMLGISVFTDTYLIVKEFIKKVKNELNVKIIVGGPHITTYPQTIKENKEIDIGVIGEGDITIVEIANYYFGKKSKLENIKGITYLKDGEQIFTNKRDFIDNLGKLHLPSRDFINMKKYKYPGGIITSRGCPYKCIYCQTPYLSRNKYRTRPLDDIKNEIELLINKHNLNYIYFWDDTISIHKNRFVKLIKYLKEKKVNWYCETRVDGLDNSILKLMKEAGCNQIQIGVESIKNERLDLIQKEINIVDIEKIIEKANKLGIQVNIGLLFGLPGQTREELIEMINWGENKIKNGRNRVEISYLIPYPKTEIYEYGDSKYKMDIRKTFWKNKKQLLDYIPFGWTNNGSLSYKEVLGYWIFGKYSFKKVYKEKYDIGLK